MAEDAVGHQRLDDVMVRQQLGLGELGLLGGHRSLPLSHQLEPVPSSVGGCRAAPPQMGAVVPSYSSMSNLAPWPSRRRPSRLPWA